MAAGASLATLNYCSKVVDEFCMARSQKDSDGRAAPLPLKTRTQASNVELRQRLSLNKQNRRFRSLVPAKRYSLTMALKARGNTISERGKEIACRKRRLASARQEKPSHLELVSDAEN